MLGEGNECLYVVEILGQGVKIGITANPRKRLGDHRRDAQAYGRQVGRVWCSEPHLEARTNEKRLKKLCGPGFKREYLPLSYDYVLDIVGKLPQTPHPLRGLSMTEYFRQALTPNQETHTA